MWQKRIFIFCRFSWASIFFLYSSHCAKIPRNRLCHRGLGRACEPSEPVLVSPDPLFWDCAQFWGSSLQWSSPSATSQLVLMKTGLNCISTLFLRTSKLWWLLSELLQSIQANKIKTRDTVQPMGGWNKRGNWAPQDMGAYKGWWKRQKSMRVNAGFGEGFSSRWDFSSCLKCG